MEAEVKELVVGLDIGSSAIVGMVAEIDESNNLEVIGWDRKESQGMRLGTLVDIDATVNSINHTIEMLQRQADCEIREVWSTISGSHIECKQSLGLVSIKDNEVTQSDIDRVIELARTVQMPPGKEILHTLTQEFILDNEIGIRTPLGMSGMRLEAKVHYIIGGINATQNLLRCIRRCGLEIEDLYFQPLASAESVLTPDEKELGVCLIDMGGGTTDYIVIKNQTVRHSGVIAMAGENITKAIASKFNTKLVDAEDIKRKFGKALADLAESKIEFEVPSYSEQTNRVKNAKELSNIIEPKIQEIFSILRKELELANVLQDISGIVITGGSSLLYGLEELSEHILGSQTRVGVPMIEGKLSDIVRKPDCAAAVGLLRLAQQHRHMASEYAISSGGVPGLMNKIKDWFARNF